MTAPVASDAPYNDFCLLNSLNDYSSINPDLSKAASEKLSKHLWYLSEDLVALSLFDRRISNTTKRLMIDSMRQRDGEDNPPKRLNDTVKNIRERKFESFASKRSMRLLQVLDLPIGFLEADPDTWGIREDFSQALEVVKSLNVDNDHAERGVALIQEYSGLLTRDEEQLQYLLQVVEDHRRSYPDCKKRTLNSR